MQKEPLHHKKLPLYQKILLILIGIFFAFGVSEMTYNSLGTKISDNSTVKQVEEISKTSLKKTKNAYTGSLAWYKKTNTTVTILPYILEMGLLDFVGIFFIIFFIFWLFIRYFMR